MCEEYREGRHTRGMKEKWKKAWEKMDREERQEKEEGKKEMEER